MRTLTVDSEHRARLIGYWITAEVPALLAIEVWLTTGIACEVVNVDLTFINSDRFSRYGVAFAGGDLMAISGCYDLRRADDPLKPTRPFILDLRRFFARHPDAQPVVQPPEVPPCG